MGVPSESGSDEVVRMEVLGENDRSFSKAIPPAADEARHVASSRGAPRFREEE